ncbi:SOS response-associated peptidase [Rubripirellula amarantea]|nr:SOS response-associated peptidase [Rubripirellula amarantea]
MCGRINLKTAPSSWAQLFLPNLPMDEAVAELPPRYNIAPTQTIAAVVAHDSGWRATTFRWGLVPSWADDLSIGNRMINARSETAHEKPSFKRALANRRCLIPVDGYYEWKKVSNGKQPYYIHSSCDRPLALAGLWESNSKASPQGPIKTCTIMTTSANDFAKSVHDRMPVIIDPSDFSKWLDPDVDAIEEISPMLRPANDDALAMRPVSRYVNNARNEGPQCLDPSEEE